MQKKKIGPYENTKPLPGPVGADTKEGSEYWANEITKHHAQILDKLDKESIIYKMLDLHRESHILRGSIMLKIMTNPVILLETGHLYDMWVLDEWFKSQNKPSGDSVFRCPKSNRELTDPTYIPFWAGRIFLEEQIKLIKNLKKAKPAELDKRRMVHLKPASSSSSSSSLVVPQATAPQRTLVNCPDDQKCNICQRYTNNRHIYQSHGGVSGSGPFCICEDCIRVIGGGRRKKTRKHKKTKRKKKKKVRGRKRKTKKGGKSPRRS